MGRKKRDKYKPRHGDNTLVKIGEAKAPFKKEIDVETLELITDMPPTAQKLAVAILSDKNMLRKSTKRICEIVGIKEASLYRAFKHPKFKEFLLNMVKTPALLAAPLIAEKVIKRAKSTRKCFQSEKLALQLSGVLDESPRVINVGGNVIGSQNILADVKQKEEQANEEIAVLREQIIDAEAG